MSASTRRRRRRRSVAAYAWAVAEQLGSALLRARVLLERAHRVAVAAAVGAPGQLAGEKLDEHVHKRLQIVFGTLLALVVRAEARVTRCAAATARALSTSRRVMR